MRWSDGFIAVDWGTTNRRAYLIDHRGLCAAKFEDGVGVQSVEAGDFAAAAESIRGRLGQLPLLLAGMVGSNRGWVEAPYAECPAGLEDLTERLTLVEEGRTAIVPGLSTKADDRPDVMRGEETQLFGALAAALIPSTSFVCHPGTHNKWVTVESGRITSFRTAMTGELFNLLRERGILADLLAEKVTIGDAFRDGLRRGLEDCTLAAELFSVRAAVLLGDLQRGEAASLTSGLLIGADVALGLRMAGGSEIMIMGRPELTELYAAGVAEAGYSAREVDGAAAFLAGAMAIAWSMK